MKLVFSPVRMDTPLSVAVEGDILTLNGAALDFARLPAGAVLPRSAISNDWIAADVCRDAQGELCVPLILPHGPCPGQAALFPADLVVTGTGPVRLPGCEAAAAEVTMKAETEAKTEAKTEERDDD